MSLVLQENLLGVADYGVWKMEEDPAFYLAALILSDWEKNYLDSINHPRRKMSWLASRYLIKHLMQTDEFVELLIDVHGKPFINNFPLQVSISHSNGYAAAIISKEYDVGIDIEEPHRNMEDIREKFLSEQELGNIGQNDRMQKLMVYWSAKEVMYKIWGKRKLEFRDDMFVRPFTLQQRGDLDGVLMKYGDVFKYHMHYIHKESFTLVTGVGKEVEIIHNISSDEDDV